MSVLAAAYGGITATVADLDGSALMLPSRCTGWTVGDLLYHQLLDARRALVTFASPSAEPPDVDEVSYWRSFTPGDEDGSAHVRHVRIVASAYPPGALAREWRDTAEAAARAAAACQHEAVTTQGHVLRTADFVSTLVFEATVHHLDLVVELPSAPRPAEAALRVVRRVLDGLLGTPTPTSWDDVTYALKGTGREPLTAEDRATLGELAERFPLTG